jgi:flagellar motor switch protein FliN/FliY
MADDDVPVSIVRDQASGAAPTPRRPPSPMPASGSANHTPIFKELPPQNSRPPLLNFDLVRDVELTVKIELGRTRMRLDEVLRLGVGAVVELDRLAGDPVDVFVNDRLVARGEVVVLNEKFAVRLTEVVSPIKDD